MKRTAKVRNLRSEYRNSFLINLAVIIGVLIFSDNFSQNLGIYDFRVMMLLCIVDISFTLLFMNWLEKYSITISGLYEQTLITVLSNVLTFIIMCIINALFIMSSDRFVSDLLITIYKIIYIFLADFILYVRRNNKRRFKKPKLLIVGASRKNLYRMKRMKYGVLNNYNSWYESIEGLSKQEVESFANIEFRKFDSICILDGLSDRDYKIAVNKATSLNKDLFIVPQIIDVGKTNARIVRFDDVLTLLMPENQLSWIEHFIKRLLDIILALMATVITAIPMLVIALLIKKTSPGPIFYKQVRLTRNKRKFEIYKFRTMIPDAEKLSGPKFAEKDDPRITPIGKILRACRLDELPQILNILKGDMSFVGPRPERPMFVEQFEKEIENYNYRFKVKAGLTSLSHVYGRYSTYIHDRTYYDLLYITHYSLLLDLKIMLLTAKTMLMKSAAEGEDNFKTKTVAKAKEEAYSFDKQ